MDSIHLIEAFSNAFGPSGFEGDVVKLVREHFENAQTDSLLNCYMEPAQRAPNRPTVMLDAHSDEVGFMVQSVTGRGTLKFLPLGGWNAETLPAQRIRIQTKRNGMVPALVASTPPHFRSGSGDKKMLIGDLFLDVGSISREETLEKFGVDIGDPAAPDVRFSYDKERDVMTGKAFDNRLGCAAVLEILDHFRNRSTACNLVGTLTAQEEVGTRGASVAARRVKPDLAIVLEGSPADDLVADKHETQCALGKGVQIRHVDRGCISHPGLIEFAVNLAKKHGIRCQRAVRTGGGTNAAAIHLAGAGVPTLVLGVPSRFIHAHCGFAKLSDYNDAVRLAKKAIEELDAETIKRFSAGCLK